MTSAEIRQSFLDFFKSKGHTIVPSSSLLPDAPNLLFTNAGMNQFVPIFLGQTSCPYPPRRAADTQKCIRAGGKHNDLEDVGLDTYHHTFFEMLGNWSFGDPDAKDGIGAGYFKREAINWAWELLVERWKFPKERLYATYFAGDDGVSHVGNAARGETPADTEARDLWLHYLPADHVLGFGRKDNFWMMGDTGPCGPCSEIHVDLTQDKKGGRLVNAGNPLCIEIWNLVFIQFNANADDSLGQLSAKHVDTGMGFERVCGIIQCTNQFKDFSCPISNYETDVFRPIFDELEKLSGKKYTGTLPVQSSALGPATADKPQYSIDIAFRVIADHIRCLSFAIADGVLPSNEGRGYVLRRILRRAIRYGRNLGFHEPFFYKLADVVASNFGDVFPELHRSKAKVQRILKGEEESFNRTLDRGIELFNEEVERLGSARVPRADFGVSPKSSVGARYSKRRVPHFERPWAKYAVSFSTAERRALSPATRDIVLNSILHLHKQGRYSLYVACVMPDHVHLLFEPQIKEEDEQGKPIFWSLTELLHSLKSFTAHEINKAEGHRGPVWEKESFDRIIRSDADLEEKFHYICRNPWDSNVVSETESYPWLWTEEQIETTPRRAAEESTRDACAPQPQPSDVRVPQTMLSGEFTFKLYDTYGFPLDLTELMARERGLTVDVAGFEKLMGEQRERARKDYKKKKAVVAVAHEGLKVEPTKFLGYENLEADAVVVGVASVKHLEQGTFDVALDQTPFYAEMGGQVGDTGLLHVPGHDRTEIGRLQIIDTQELHGVFLHRAKLSSGRAPEIGEGVRVAVDAGRRANIQRHHTVTHLFHWALHEIVSRDARQRGSLVAPDHLRFDFNNPERVAPQQLADIERLVNERIKENAPVYWFEVPYEEIKGNPNVRQFFGEKYGDSVRVVQIGGHDRQLDGFSAELCGGTHTRTTGDISFFKIARESAIAAGIRRIEAHCGQFATEFITRQKEQGRLGAEREKARGQEKELAKKRQAELQAKAPQVAEQLVAKAQTVSGVRLIAENLGEVDGDFLRAVNDALRAKMPSGIIVLGCSREGKVALLCFVTPDLVKAGKHAGKIISEIAKHCGGSGGGRPDFAQAGGGEVSSLGQALAAVPFIVQEQK